jgi:hypothetical protein
VTLRTQSNYRSPRPIVELLRRLLPGDLDIEAASPIAADEIEILDYADTRACSPASRRPSGSATPPASRSTTSPSSATTAASSRTAGA